MANTIGCSISDLNGNDLLDKEIAQNLRNDGAADHELAVGIVSHSLEIARRYHEQAQHGGDGQQRQDGGGETPMRAGGLDLALQAETLANDIREPRKDFTEVAASLPLQQNRRGEEAAIEQRNADREVVQRDIDGRAEILFVEEGTELLAQRV